MTSSRREYPERPVVGVGGVVIADGRALLIRRGHPPLEGEWSIPGGKVEWGETLAEAALRELREETGVEAELGGLIAVYEIVEPDFHYVLIDYAARWRSGEARAADDADAACFMSFDDALAAVSRDDLRDVLIRSKG